MLGKDLIIQKRNADGTYSAIAGAQSCEINTECDLIEISSPSTGTSKEFISGRKGWSIDVGYLVGEDFAADVLAVGDNVYLTADVPGKSHVAGNAIVSKCHITAQTGSLAKGSFIFTGTGELKSA